jgi:hypothetical protein
MFCYNTLIYYPTGSYSTPLKTTNSQQLAQTAALKWWPPFKYFYIKKCKAIPVTGRGGP